MIITNQIKDRLEAWWNHEDQESPCFVIKVTDTGSGIPDTDDLNKYWTDESFIIQREMMVIEKTKYLCEAVPYHYVNLGGVPLGACLGGTLQFIDKETTWNKPFISHIEEVCGLDVKEDNIWWKLIKNITKESAGRARNHHYVGYCAFSGLTDILSAVYGIEPLLLDFIDNPKGVKKALNHLLSIWIRLYWEILNIIKDCGNEGFVGSWPGIWSSGTSFPLQEDISYMISIDMFKEFCLPYIEALTHVIDYPYYHLDGIGAVKFVDLLTSIHRLKVIQWIPGAGNEEMGRWHDLIRYIIGKGKSVHVYAREEEVEPLVKAVGNKGLLISLEFCSMEKALKFIERYR